VTFSVGQAFPEIEGPQHASETAFQDKFSTNPASGHQSIISTARFRKAIFCRLKPTGRIVDKPDK
jgi:hypothetical protein